MILLVFISIVFVYAMIGGFICGLVDEDEFFGLWLFLWPIILVIVLVARAAEFTSNVGSDIRDLIQSYFEKE